MKNKHMKFLKFIDIKTYKNLLLFCIVFTSNQLFAQHHEDTLIALPKNAFSINLLQNTETQFQLEIVNNTTDTLSPLFIEINVAGFEFTEHCILNQQINTTDSIQNIEQLLGSQFISLGIDSLTPSTKYRITLLTISKKETSTLNIRLFGSNRNQHLIWNGLIKQ